MIIHLIIGVSVIDAETKDWFVNKKLVKQAYNGRLTYFNKASILYPQPEREVAS